MKYIVAPKNIHLSLLNSLRKDDPFLDIKIYSKEELSRFVYPLAREEAVVYLMKKYHYSYEVSRAYLRELPYIENDSNNPKFHFLFALKKELEDNELLYSPNESTLANKEVTVIGYQKEDFELSYLLNRLAVTPHYVTNEKKDRALTVNIFEKIEEETYYVLNEIASLIDKGESINNIFIIRRNGEYDYYLKKFAPLFGYQINLTSGNNLFSTGGAKEFFKLYESNKDIEASLTLLKEMMKEDELYLEIEDVVNNNLIEADYDIQKDYLLNKFKEVTIKEEKFTKAVNVFNYPINKTNSYIFVLGFAQGQFPQSFKDDKYLNNDELTSINRLNSKDRTKLDELSLIDFFNSNNHFSFCFSEKSSSGGKYLSPLEKIMGFSKIRPELSDTFYSEKVLKLIYSNLKDLDYFYREKKENYYKVRDVISLDYNSYDNKYNYKAKAFDESTQIKLSTTALELFSYCPFHYYLERVLCVDEFETTYSMALGNLTHYLIEHCRDKNFDFDKEFDAQLEGLDLKYSERYLLNHNLKEKIRIAVEAIKTREKYYTNPKIYNERKFNYSISSNTILTGKIDNLVILNDQYFICIDYKTGSTKFDSTKLEYGIHTQLPTYSLLVSNTPEFAKYTVAGLYINNLIPTKIKNVSKEDELIPSYLKLNGKTLGDIKVVELIDSTIANKKSSFINSVSLKSDCSGLKDSKSVITPFEFDEYIEIVKNKYKEMDEKLRSNSFDIYPYFAGSREFACSYCPYKDICYVREVQYHSIKEEEDDE